MCPGETAKPVEPKIDIKPEISGRIEATPPPLPTITHHYKGRDTREAVSPPLQGGAGGGIPDIFLRQIPSEDKPTVTPDFVPPKEEPVPQSSKEAKNTLNKALNSDPYKEPV